MNASNPSLAIIGSGIAGLSAAWALRGRYEVTLFEQDIRAGGHANTVTIDYDGQLIDVDTGFIVYNDANYPNLVGLFETLGIETRQTDMSFACASDDLEWASTFPQGVFAQKRNLVRPRFLAMLNDIRRFNARAVRDLATGQLEDMTLGVYLKRHRFGATFKDRYLLPMGAAIWSSRTDTMLDTPAQSFLQFLSNHGLLQFTPPVWRTVVGGSRTYVDEIRAALDQRLKLGRAIASVQRTEGQTQVTAADGSVEAFDHVLLACHSDQALALLQDADSEERAFLGAIRFGQNTAVLHRDLSLMPKRRAAWGSWSYMTGSRDSTKSYVNYWMNNLQSIDVNRPLFVSLNGPAPDPALTFARFDYAHPIFDSAALAAQQQFNRIQGRGGIWYAGAWLGYGFHEDGITAGLRVAQALGADVPWTFVDHRIPGGPLLPPDGVQRAPALERARA